MHYSVPHPTAEACCNQPTSLPTTVDYFVNCVLCTSDSEIRVKDQQLRSPSKSSRRAMILKLWIFRLNKPRIWLVHSTTSRSTNKNIPTTRYRQSNCTLCSTKIKRLKIFNSWTGSHVKYSFHHNSILLLSLYFCILGVSLYSIHYNHLRRHECLYICLIGSYIINYASLIFPGVRAARCAAIDG
jgi:hypothetical protein